MRRPRPVASNVKHWDRRKRQRQNTSQQKIFEGQERVQMKLMATPKAV